MAELDILRRAAFQTRVDGVVGKRVAWASQDVARIRDHVAGLSEKALRGTQGPLTAQHKFLDGDRGAVRNELAKAGVQVKDAQSADSTFLFVISSSRVDLQNDAVDPNGVDSSGFSRNPVVLNSHDSSALPIATSSRPFLSGPNLMAFARFPAAGVSADSDRIAAAIRAGLVKGASVGFVPLKWTFSKDPARPMGVDFHQVKLLEWSCCAIPCNPDCLVIGAAAGDKAATETAARRIEARALTTIARHFSKSQSVATTRAQRLAEAAALRRAAGI
jgi:phage head maturation protease